ncbi:hypothetical protein QC763_0062440 [Podospora pseudopauciseta]|uniref:Uncharacterized protein n=1 Tax=Podospora pseudopauciseta TaxID=2093780 RepID=A0ABR0HC47_9PEZI|nr:hypothetical protein QC763_0062440 [Podospora pseudopauciseta]
MRLFQLSRTLGSSVLVTLGVTGWPSKMTIFGTEKTGLLSRHWYSKASDKAPTTGRLYHHLAISLCVAIPFGSARESIITMFDPIMVPTPNQQSRLSVAEFAFVKVHAVMFSSKQMDKLQSTMDDFLRPPRQNIRLTGHG